MNIRNSSFLSCDWGTSSFRLRWVNSESLSVLTEQSSNQGIVGVFRQWQQQSGQSRTSFYLGVVKRHIYQMEQRLKVSLQNIPLVISGMASSSLGIMELEYKDLPFATDGSDLKVYKISSSGDFPHEVLLISGVSTKHDVMRGEETQLIGCLDKNRGDQIVILPGTHSKHVFVRNGKVEGFKTYMTGECFELFASKSILYASVEKGGDINDLGNLTSFEKGLLDSQQFNLLHACFRVRTNVLLEKMDLQQNYYYLSGLLIGTELHDLIANETSSITLVSNDLLSVLYVLAIKYLLPDRNLKIENVDLAIVKGHFMMFNQYILKKEGL